MNFDCNCSVHLGIFEKYLFSWNSTCLTALLLELESRTPNMSESMLALSEWPSLSQTHGFVFHNIFPTLKCFTNLFTVDKF